MMLTFTSSSVERDGLRLLRTAAVALMALLWLGMSACSSGAGEDCADDSECERGTICQSGVCNAVPCFNRNECPLELQTCTESGFCSAIECIEDADCLASNLGTRCVEQACFSSCSTRDDCPAGQICSPETSQCEPASGICNSDDECPAGQTCDVDINRCVDGDAPNNGPNNNPNNNPNNEPNNNPNNDPNNNPGGGELCEPCTLSTECGGDGDECTALANGQHCTTSCDTDADCQAGFECAQAIPNVSPQQCLPVSNRCEGCLLPDQACGAGQICDPDTLTCTTPLSNCQPCNDDSQCVPGGRCYQDGDLQVCGEPCNSPADCGAGYTCSNRDGANICVTLDACGANNNCDPAPECTGDAPILNEEFCTCVECSENGDCPTMQVCGTNFRCLAANQVCENGGDCAAPTPFCLGGYCVGCVSDVDCTNPGDVCIAGQCQACMCPQGQRCDARGNCVDASGCTSDADCAMGLLGPGQCDQGTGSCYEAGRCGPSDGFNSVCPAGQTCSPTLGGLVNVCTGCDPNAPNCRNGENCIPSLDDPNVFVCAGF